MSKKFWLLSNNNVRQVQSRDHSRGCCLLFVAIFFIFVTIPKIKITYAFTMWNCRIAQCGKINHF